MCSMKRVIFHIDVNSAYLSWEAVSRLAAGDTVDLREIPSAVGGDVETRHGVILAKSIPAKKYGIVTGEPVVDALRKCPDLTLVKPHHTMYREKSKAFIAILQQYSDTIEQFSVDEAFVDMTGTERLFGTPIEAANRIREQVYREQGFTVNVGVSSNKLLAKMASDFQKPNRVHTLFPEEIEEKMWPLPVGDLLWVGKKSAEKLTAYGIRTIGQLAAAPENVLLHLFGTKGAKATHDSANGIDESPVSTEEEEAKSYSAERTFSSDITDPKQLDRQLFNVACIVAHRIRRDHFAATNVSVFVKTKDFVSRSKQHTITYPTDVTAVILNEARRLIPEVWDGVTPLRQVGLSLSRLTHDMPLTLFEDENMEYYRQWDADYDRKMEEQEKRDRHYRNGRSKALKFSYANGEQALRAAKNSVKEGNGCSFARNPLPDGTDCFEVKDAEGKVIELHMIVKSLTGV